MRSKIGVQLNILFKGYDEDRLECSIFQRVDGWCESIEAFKGHPFRAERRKPCRIHVSGSKKGK